MKHITLIGTAALLSVSLHGQVFTSGVEDWTGMVPDDFVGSKTNIAASAVTQVTDNPHGGTYAVRLENATTSHKRFTTQPVPVTNGTAYEISFWVRGEGEIRVGLYDGRPGGSSGYSAYNPQNYVPITGNTWQQISLTVVAAYDTINAEFILSMRNTVAPEHLVVDDVNITETIIAPPVSATITEIQMTTDPGGASPLVNQAVITTGVVSALTGTNGYFLQDGTGPWTGIYVFGSTGTLARGDNVTVTATVDEFNSQTQLINVLSTVVNSSGNATPSTSITTAAGNTEPYESVLVQVMAANCTASGPFGQFTVTDGSGDVLTDDVIYAYPFVVGTIYDITGVLQYAFSEWRILPRDVADVSISTSIGELAGATVTVYPNPANTTLNLDLSTLSGRTEYSVTDMLGRVVITDVATVQRNIIEVSGLSSGTYVVTLRNAGAVWSMRLQVQH